jgi:hypothetical protein
MNTAMNVGRRFFFLRRRTDVVPIIWIYGIFIGQRLYRPTW